MAIQYLGTTISGVSGDTKPSIGADTISANEKGVLFIETDTNKMYQWDGDSWNEVTPTNTTALSSGRTIGMTGDVTWTSASFDGSGNVTGTAAIGTGVVVNADVNASAAIAMSKTALVGGTGLTLATNTLNVDAAQTQITSVGDLDGGSITSNFGSIDTGTSNITTTGTITAGNLSVTGTTTTVNSTNTTITDRLIELASGASASTADAGIIIERGSTGNNAIMAWDEANDRFIFGTTEATGSSTGTLTISVGTVNADIVGNVTGRADTATTLHTARTIGGVSFNGSANINLSGVNVAGNQDTSGNAATATVLETARTIGGTSFNGSANIAVALAAEATILANARTLGGVSFNGSANIDLPGVNIAGTQDTSGNAATATILATARTIGGVSFNGSANINLPGVNASGTQDTSGTAAIATTVTLAGSGNVTYYPTFVDATSGSEAVRVDSDWTYNGSTNKMTVGNIGVPDSGKIELGASQDLQIYHDGSNSIIDHTGTGQLLIGTEDEVRITKDVGGEFIARFIKDSGVYLYHNNVLKFETTSAGATVTGDLTTTGNLKVAADGYVWFGDVNHIIDVDAGFMAFKMPADEHFYWAEGGNNIMKLDGTNRRLGIGLNASPDHTLLVYNESLGGTAGNETNIARFGSASANADSFVMTGRRDANGSDWTTARLKIQRRVDVTDMGYMAFGHPDTGTVLFGNGDTDYFKMLMSTSGEKSLTLDSPDGAYFKLDRGATSNDATLEYYTAGALKWKVGMDSSGGATDAFEIKRTNNATPDFMINSSGNATVTGDSLTLDTSNGEGWIYFKGQSANDIGMAWTFSTATDKFASIRMDHTNRAATGLQYHTTHYPMTFDIGASETSTDFAVFNVNQSESLRVTKTTVEVAGQVKIAGGSPGADKVLTSDADGLATWEEASGGGGAGTAIAMALVFGSTYS